MDYDLETECGNCGAREWLTDPARGDYICAQCGLVLPDHIIDCVSEVRNCPSDFFKQNQASDAYFSSFQVIGNKKSKLAKTQSYIQSTTTLEEKHLEAYFPEIEKHATLMSLAKCTKDLAKDILNRYEKATDKRGLNPTCAAICALHIACAEQHIGYTLNDMLVNLGDDVSEDDLRRTRKRILVVLPGLGTHTRVEDVLFVQCGTLGLPAVVQRVAGAIRELCQDRLQGARTPSTVAAGCIFLACELLQHPVDKADVATAALIAESTVSNFCRLVKKHFDPILPPHKLEKIKNL